jgi:hypothetical protein
MIRIPLFMICFMGVVWGLRVNADTSCTPYYIPSRLLIGSEGRVVMEGGANNVRAGAAANANKLGQLPPGSTFRVVDGPVCGGGDTWVRVDNGAGLIGWTVEIIEGRYALEPNVSVLPPAVFGPGPVDYGGIHFELNGDLATQVEAKFLLSEQVKAQTLPPHIEFTFTPTNPGQFPFMTLRVMSAQSFNNLYLTSISRLASFLANPGSDPINIPTEMAAFVTDWATIRQHTQIVPFGSGQVFRGFSTIWQDATAPSDFLIYAAHGLSNDGQYYIQADFFTYYYDLSIYQPPEGSRDDMDSYIKNFHANIDYTIDAARDEDFTPRPSQIDALLASLTIAPGTLGEVIAQASVVAGYVAPTQEAMFIKQTEQANAAATVYAQNTATQVALAPALTATADARCGVLDTRLHVGQNARQAMSGNSSLRVRDAAGGTVIPETFLYPGDVVMVLEGPVCVDEVNWWRVTSAQAGWTGWIAESKDDNYYMSLIPPTPTPYPTRVPATAIPDYKCTYRPNSGDERASLVPRQGGEWQYYLFYEDYKAVGRYTDNNGETWYLFSPQSSLYGFADGGGSVHNRSFWGSFASGSGCSRLPEVYGSMIERSYD